MWGTSRNSDLLGKFIFTKNMSLSVGYLVNRGVDGWAMCDLQCI